MNEDTRCNPFDANTDSDRASIWRMLVERDCHAFTNSDWSRVADDFDEQNFDGIDAGGSSNPDRWTLRYPTLASYRDAWLTMAGSFRSMRLPPATGHLDLIYQVTRLNVIEIQGDRALAHKKFCGRQPLIDGGTYEVRAQSLYRLRREHETTWRICGFVGYLPLHDPETEITP